MTGFFLTLFSLSLFLLSISIFERHPSPLSGEDTHSAGVTQLHLDSYKNCIYIF